MVLITGRQEGADVGALLSRRRLLRSSRGSSTLEFALIIPAAVLLLVLLLHAGLLAADLVVVQGLAREAARAAAVSNDDGAKEALVQAAGERPVSLTLRPPGVRAPGSLVTAEVRLRSAGFAAFGVDVWVPASATMRVEA